MLTTAANYHRSKLPQLGQIGYLTNGKTKYGEPLYWKGERQKYQVIAYPLCDNVRPYSFGIHTAYFQNLRTGDIRQFSGFYFEPLTT